MASFIMLLTSSTTNAVLNTHKQTNQSTDKKILKTHQTKNLPPRQYPPCFNIYNTLLIYNRIENTKSKSVEEQNILNDDEKPKQTD